MTFFYFVSYLVQRYKNQRDGPSSSCHLILVCVNYDLNGSLRINSRLHARLNNLISHPIFVVNWLWRCGVTASFGIFHSWSKMYRNDKFHGIHVMYQKICVNKIIFAKFGALKSGSSCNVIIYITWIPWNLSFRYILFH